MADAPPPVRISEFDAVDTTDESEIKRVFSPFVRSLHAYLNELRCLRDVQKTRRRWKARVAHPEAFGNLATDPRHWYTFHHGGRTEAQFNVGLYPTHLRVGLGFEFSLKKGGDPTAVQYAYACFTNLVRAGRHEFERFVTENGLEIEWVDTSGDPLRFIPTKDAVDLLLNLPREPLWVFVGRLLRREEDSAILGNAELLGGVMQKVFCGFRPIWEQTQMMAGA